MVRKVSYERTVIKQNTAVFSSILNCLEDCKKKEKKKKKLTLFDGDVSAVQSGEERSLRLGILELKQFVLGDGAGPRPEGGTRPDGTQVEALVVPQGQASLVKLHGKHAVLQTRRQRERERERERERRIHMGERELRGSVITKNISMPNIPRCVIGNSRKIGTTQTLRTIHNSLITYYWTGLLILEHSYLVGNLTNSKIADTKALEPLKS
jgi:hypothetical protein